MRTYELDRSEGHCITYMEAAARHLDVDLPELREAQLLQLFVKAVHGSQHDDLRKKIAEWVSAGMLDPKMVHHKTKSRLKAILLKHGDASHQVDRFFSTSRAARQDAAWQISATAHSPNLLPVGSVKPLSKE